MPGSRMPVVVNNQNMRIIAFSIKCTEKKQNSLDAELT
jgi:hypothetical protein